MSGPVSGRQPESEPSPDFWAWFDAREPALQRLAFLLTLEAGRGRALLARVKLATIRRIGGGVCLVLSTLALLQVFEVIAL